MSEELRRLVDEAANSVERPHINCECEKDSPMYCCECGQAIEWAESR